MMIRAIRGDYVTTKDRSLVGADENEAIHIFLFFSKIIFSKWLELEILVLLLVFGKILRF